MHIYTYIYVYCILYTGCIDIYNGLNVENNRYIDCMLLQVDKVIDPRVYIYMIRMYTCTSVKFQGIFLFF